MVIHSIEDGHGGKYEVEQRGVGYELRYTNKKWFINRQKIKVGVSSIALLRDAKMLVRF